MSPAVEAVALPTRSEIEAWGTAHLTDAAASWRTAAAGSEGAFDEHRQNISSPGGTAWSGDAKDAALNRVTKDIAVVGRHGAVVREAVTLADDGAHDIKAAKDKVVEAIKAAEDDGFTVAEDLSVTDSRDYDITTVADRNTSAAEHAEDIRWTAEQLVQTDKLVGSRLQAKAVELEGIQFDGEGEGDGSPRVQLVSNEFKNSPIDIPEDKDKLSPDDAPPSPAPGQVGPFPVPKSVEDAAKKSGDKPDAKTPDPSGLGGLLGADDPAKDKPEDGKSPLPPALGQLPPRPDQAMIDRQVAKVEAARKALANAEAKLTAGAVENYTLGAGNGPTHDDARALAQSVFDARKELTDQTKALRDLNGAVVANGGSPIPIPQLPENADIQAFPKEPSEFERSSKALSDGSFGFIPDVAKDLHTLDNWDQASAADRMQAVVDAAGLVPLPGAKLLGEGAHGLEALGGIARHVDDIPGPHAHVEAPGAGHAPVDSPAAGHGPVDAPVEHHGPEPVSAPEPMPAHQSPDVFDPNQGAHYTSGDAHYPGGWPPSTPPETWQPGSSQPGWHYVDRGERPWMPYQEQISGAERLPDGRLPEYVETDPQTGRPVHFDGHDVRGGREIFLDAKDGYSSLATDPGKPWTLGMERSIVEEIPRQLRALPPGAELEIHVSDPAGAAAIRNLVESNGWFDVSVVYTPKAP